MTLRIDGTDIGQIIEIAIGVGILVAILAVALIVYLMVRPPRDVRDRRKAKAKAEMDPIEAEQLWRLVDRMESRLEVLERVLADQADQNGRRAIGADGNERAFAPAEDGRDLGRKE